MERKDHVCSRPLIPRLPLCQSISKVSQTRNQPTTNISTLINPRRRLANSGHRTSNHNPLNFNCNNSIRPSLHPVQKQSATLLHCTSPTQPNRRLHNRRRNPDALADNVCLVRLRNPHIKPNQHNSRVEQLPNCSDSNAENKRHTKTTARPTVTPVSFRTHLNSLASLLPTLSPFNPLRTLDSTFRIPNSLRVVYTRCFQNSSKEHTFSKSHKKLQQINDAATTR